MVPGVVRDTRISPLSRISSEGGDLCCCRIGCIVAAVGCIVDTLGVPSLPYVSSEESGRRKIYPSVSRLERRRGCWGTCAVLYHCCGEWSRTFQARSLVSGRRRIYPSVSRFEQERGWGTCATVAALSCLVATLDSMDVRCDEEGFTPPGYIENGV